MKDTESEGVRPLTATQLVEQNRLYWKEMNRKWEEAGEVEVVEKPAVNMEAAFISAITRHLEYENKRLERYLELLRG